MLLRVSPVPVVLFVALLAACNRAEPAPAATPAAASVKKDSAPPPLDPTNIVSIAVGSQDHTTLVTALQAADYVKSVANPGPLTVFAPTNAAFAKLPAGTVEGLLQPARQAELKEIIKYHATTSVYDVPQLRDGMQLAMANGKKVQVKVAADGVTINGAKVLASIRASNGIVHVLDGVLLPPKD
jgi:uncharacterized surface protein with fasciclin (FAS1) repeats